MSKTFWQRPSIRAAAGLLFACALVSACGGGGGGSKNTPPVTSFTAAPTSGIAPLTVAFDGSASSDREGPLAAYAWNFGDGSAGASGATASHVYQGAGTFTATLTVTDRKGATASATQTITVNANKAPLASFSASPSSGSAPLVVTCDASASSDPDGTIAKYEWTFGDGATGTGVTAQHTFAAAGTYEIVLQVTDDRGASGTATRSVTVTATTAASWYSIKEIPSLGGWYAEPRSVTIRGWATGFSYFDGSGVGHAFFFNGTNSIDLGTLGGAESYGNDVNHVGDVVGASVTAEKFTHAFLYDIYQTPRMKDLGTLGGFSSEATGINNRGQIVGRAEDKDGFVRAFLYEGGQMRSLGTLGGDFSVASAINEKGQVAGMSRTAAGQEHVFLYSDGGMTDLGGGAIGMSVWVEGLNDAGDIVGMWHPLDGYLGYTGFLYRGGVMRSLAAGYTEPRAINNAGVVVGTAHFNNEAHAAIWDAVKGLQDLNALVDPSLGWTLQVASGINDEGQIVGHGYKAGGASVAVLLTPAAKPAP